MNRSVAVRLQQEAVGPGLVWPPVSIERLWVRRVEDDLYAVDNIPFFAKGIGIYDTIVAFADPSLDLLFSAVQTRSAIRPFMYFQENRRTTTQTLPT